MTLANLRALRRVVERVDRTCDPRNDSGSFRPMKLGGNRDRTLSDLRAAIRQKQEDHDLAKEFGYFELGGEC